jgi:hypothetical protein
VSVFCVLFENDRDVNQEDGPSLSIYCDLRKISAQSQEVIPLFNNYVSVIHSCRDYTNHCIMLAVFFMNLLKHPLN